MKLLSTIVFILTTISCMAQDLSSPEKQFHDTKDNGMLMELNVGYGEYHTNMLQNWLKLKGLQTGGSPQMIIGFQIKGITRNFTFGINLDGASDFKTSHGPEYMNAGFDGGYCFIISEHFAVLPQIGMYFSRTELNFGRDRPVIFRDAHYVPDKQDALLIQDGFAIHPGIHLVYFPNLHVNSILFYSLSVNSMINIHESPWEYGYIERIGKASYYRTDKVSTIPVNTYNSSWSITAGIGIGGFWESKRKAHTPHLTRQNS